MATDLRLTLTNSPGELARLGETLGAAGVNIEGVVGLASGGSGEIHVLVEDGDAARTALEVAGFVIDEAREVLVTDCSDTPGELGRVTRKVADAGVNITFAYLATGTRLVIAADDLAGARAAL